MPRREGEAGPGTMATCNIRGIGTWQWWTRTYPGDGWTGSTILGSRFASDNSATPIKAWRGGGGEPPFRGNEARRGRRGGEEGSKGGRHGNKQLLKAVLRARHTHALAQVECRTHPRSWAWFFPPLVHRTDVYDGTQVCMGIDRYIRGVWSGWMNDCICYIRGWAVWRKWNFRLIKTVNYFCFI